MLETRSHYAAQAGLYLVSASLMATVTKAVGKKLRDSTELVVSKKQSLPSCKAPMGG